MAYNGVLHLGADPIGLHLSLAPGFGFGHPPLYIPWSEITATAERRRLAGAVRFGFRRQPSVPLRVARRLAEQLQAASDGAFSIQPARS